MPSSNFAPSGVKDKRIDILKGLGMIGVIIVHFNRMVPSPFPAMHIVALLGARCPQLFFLLSAYLTWQSLSRHPRIPSVFIKSRLKRIAPLYYAALVLSVFLPVVRFSDFSLGNYLSHLFFVNGFFPQWTNSIMYIEWYIADLAIFSFIAPFLFRWVNSLHRSITAFLASVLLSSLFLVLANHFLPGQISRDSVQEAYFHTFFFVHQLPVMLLGTVLYFLRNQENCSRRKTTSVFLWSCIITMLFLALFVILNLNKVLFTSSLVAGMIFGCVVQFFWLLPPMRSPLLDPLAVLGRKSYGCYCFHQLLINCIILIPINMTTRNIWPFALFLTIAASFSVGSSAEGIMHRISSKQMSCCSQ